MTRRPRHQDGAALLAAMLVVTLVATLAASALWQQWRGVQVEAAERQRQQAAWVLTGALDWARLILREDGRSGGADHLAEPWAVPLAESRLSSFLAADRNTAATDGDDAYDAFLSGEITDAQARLNVTNLIDGARISEPALQAWIKLYEALSLPAAEVTRMAENLRFASDNSADNRSGGFAALRPRRVDDLRWLGVSEASLRRLAPYIALLPVRTPVNANTASAEVLYAIVPGLEMGDARRLVANRQRTHYRTLADIGQVVPQLANQLGDGQLSIASRYFEVRGRLRLDDLVVEERSLVQRDGLDVKTVWRERSTPPAPPAGGGAGVPTISAQ